MVVVVDAKVDLDPMDLAGEAAASCGVIGGDARPGLVPDVGRFIS